MIESLITNSQTKEKNTKWLVDVILEMRTQKTTICSYQNIYPIFFIIHLLVNDLADLSK